MSGVPENIRIPIAGVEYTPHPSLPFVPGAISFNDKLPIV
jgi:hypothetical protein